MQRMSSDAPSVEGVCPVCQNDIDKCVATRLRDCPAYKSASDDPPSKCGNDIVERLRHTAGHLINGTIEDGGVEVAMLCDAADEIERLRFVVKTLRFEA